MFALKKTYEYLAFRFLFIRPSGFGLVKFPTNGHEDEGVYDKTDNKVDPKTKTI